MSDYYSFPEPRRTTISPEVFGLLLADIGRSYWRATPKQRHQLMQMLEYESFWRVEFDLATGRATVQAYMPGAVDTSLDGCYASIEDLPHPLKDRCTVLYAIDPPPPPHNPIEGVGQRMSRNVFWIFMHPPFVRPA